MKDDIETIKLYVKIIFYEVTIMFGWWLWNILGILPYH